jgi:Flp pilus assembly protein protease CpaA
VAVGAILHFAVTATREGIDIQSVGAILIIGVIGFAISLWLYVGGRRAGQGSPAAAIGDVSVRRSRRP